MWHRRAQPHITIAQAMYSHVAPSRYRLQLQRSRQLSPKPKRGRQDRTNVRIPHAAGRTCSVLPAVMSSVRVMSYGTMQPCRTTSTTERNGTVMCPHATLTGTRSARHAANSLMEYTRWRQSVNTQCAPGGKHACGTASLPQLHKPPICALALSWLRGLIFCVQAGTSHVPSTIPRALTSKMACRLPYDAAKPSLCPCPHLTFCLTKPHPSSSTPGWTPPAGSSARPSPRPRPCPPHPCSPALARPPPARCGPGPWPCA